MFYGNFKGPDDHQYLREAIARFRTIFGQVFAGDNVILFQRTLGFRRNKKFMEALSENVKTRQERSLVLRLNTLAWAGKHALNFEGDFVECGVWRGFSSAVLARYLDFGTVDKTYYLYDTFAGIPAGYDTEKHDSPLFAKAGLYEQVVERFRPYPNVRIVRGTVPESFQEACPEKVAFLHLDMNSSKSEIAALDVLFDRIVPGGMIVFDDYGWTAYRRQQLTEDEFMGKRGYRILELPTGQGLLVKRTGG